ncbi:MAG: hypothetical protein QOJ65_1557 [Fimbriimonadaceae bacterium]|nr:hypothetical protein [Fimbriimonadaceae bacterium]
MGALAVIAGIVVIILVLWDSLETVILPRTVARRIGVSSFLNGFLKQFYVFVGRRVSGKKAARERLLGAFGPISLLILIVVWAWSLIVGLSLIQWGLDTPLSVGPHQPLGVHLYASAVTFFTLGYGDVTATNSLGRIVDVFEAGIGFGFLALVIGYIPVLYGSFSSREATILLLDARAGSPPTAGELLSRYDAPGIDALEELLADMEKWCANLLESYLSYPVLALYRSQHERMSWLSALTMIMDACTLLRVTCDRTKPEQSRLVRQAELSYALARHVVIDLAYVLDIPPQDTKVDRLPPAEWQRLVEKLRCTDLFVCNVDADYEKVRQLRRDYEPYLTGVSETLFLALPPWLPQDGELDSWEVTAWDAEKHF